MITFTSLGDLGRFGNQLFQYAALKAVAHRTGFEPKIPDPSTLVCQSQKCYFENFNIDCAYLTAEDYSLIDGRFIEPNHSFYFPQVFDIADNTDLYGYFQNYRYFKDIEEQIREEFTIKEEFSAQAAKYLASVKNTGDPSAEIVSVHMRRGDWIEEQMVEGEYQYVDFYGNGDELSKDSKFGKYFYPALEVFSDRNVKFLVFSGGSKSGDTHNQSDIEWCKTNFNGDRIYYSEGNSDLVDFEIMRQCEHNITCHMTSFGWWAALLNENPNKIVTAPKRYTIPDDGRADFGFYPPGWILL